MTTYTVYSGYDGYIQYTAGSYANNRAGTTTPTVNTTGTIAYLGQNGSGGTDSVYEAFVSFDTSSVVGTVASATLSLYGAENGTTTDFIATAAIRDFGATLEAADWVAGDSLSGLTTVATFDTTGYAASYMAFTDVAFPANVNVGGNTRIILYSSRTSGNNNPTGFEYFGFSTVDASGTSQDPKLVIVTAGSRPQRHRPYHIWRS